MSAFSMKSVQSSRAPYFIPTFEILAQNFSPLQKFNVARLGKGSKIKLITFVELGAGGTQIHENTRNMPSAICALSMNKSLDPSPI